MTEEMTYTINQKIASAQRIFIMPHKGIDLDAFGASLGLYFYIKSLGKSCQIVLKEYAYDSTIDKALEELKNRNISFEYYDFTKEETFNDKDLLLILDCYKKELTDDPDLFDKIENKIIIDHHYSTEPMNPNILTYILNQMSSTCEIITELIKENKDIPKYIYTLLLSGIAVDTHNFTMKVSARTYEVAALLTNLGADPKEVQYLLKENLIEYFDIQKILQNLLILNDKIAICTCDDKIYDKEFLAKISSTMLSFERIEMSFTIGKISEDIIGISARSIGNYDVSKYMFLLNGGGSITDAATQIKDITIEEAKEKLIQTVNEV